MAAKSTKIIVRRLVKVRETPKYTLSQVIAVKPDGSPIMDGATGQELNLRTFEDLPKNVVLDVMVEKFESEQYGVSYTIKATNYSINDRVDTLEQRIKALEDRLAATSTASPPPPPPTTPPPLPQTGGNARTEDIPF